ncbi:hypothetical protein FB451DRAFT_1339488 [Mycena latifolia]|nr:hypothetical protein FB451DRAFT_1339488 [Mycena latifolia]
MALSILIIGAGGSLGLPLTRVAILSDPAKAHKFTDAQENGIEVVLGSYLDFKSYAGFDVVLSLVGSALMRLQPAMIDAALAGGVRHFYPSEFGTDITQDGVWQCRFFRDKIVTRDHLAAAAKAHPDFRYTLMLVGACSEWSYGPFSGVDAAKRTVEAYGYPDAEMSVTALKDILRYTVDSILLPFPAGQSRREIRVRGDHMTWAQLIALLEEVQGGKYKVRTIAPAGKVTVPGPLDNDKFGFVPETLKETMLRVEKRS